MRSPGLCQIKLSSLKASMIMLFAEQCGVDVFVKMISSKDFTRGGSKLTSMVFRRCSGRLDFDVFPTLRWFFPSEQQAALGLCVESSEIMCKLLWAVV